jgi:protein-S-isoprenylcysteine O-methyltransferase Ste14
MTEPDTTELMTDNGTTKRGPIGGAKPPGYDRPSLIPWPPILLIILIAAAVLLDQVYPIDWPGLRDTAARTVGLSIGAGGILLAIWSVWTLRKARTTVLPHQRAEQLVTTGPFTRFRNPIYIADVMMLLGVAELTENVWFVAAAAIFAILVTFLAIIPEERHLEARFGDQYRAYKARSRRWL